MGVVRRVNLEMAAQVAAFDWTTTTLGAIDTWPECLRSAVDLMLDAVQPVYIAWGDQHTSLFNDGYIPILGAKHPGALGRPYSELFAEIWDEYKPIVEATMDGQAHSFVDRPVPLRGRSGQPMSWFTFSWTPLRDQHGRVCGFICAAFETTEKVEARIALEAAQQAALVASEQRYRTLFDAIDEGFCVIEMLFDPSGKPYDYRFVEANPAFERHTGLTGAMGRTVREFAPEHEDYWFQAYGRVATTGEPIRFENRAASIDNRWFDVFAFRVGDPRDRQVAVLFNDVTERKAAAEVLQESDRRKDEFIATLAHELRNPLAPLRNGLHVARLTSRTNEALRGTLDMMERQLSLLVRLVDDLLDVGRISSGKLDLRLAPVELGRALASGIEAARGAVEARGHDLQVIAPGRPLFVKADHDRLAQVFANLLSNAAKYTAPGGRITVTLTNDGEDALVRVSDSGIGIPSEDLRRVFDLFAQVEGHRAENQGGLESAWPWSAIWSRFTEGR